MALEKLTNGEIAYQLGVSGRSIKRYIASGLLPAKETDSGYLIKSEDISRLKEEMDAGRLFSRWIKEIYVLERSGVMSCELMCEFGITREEILDRLIERYGKKRENYLKRFGLKDIDELLLIEEVAARLRVNTHPIYELVKEGRLKSLKSDSIIFDNKTRVFVLFDSLRDYLGEDFQTIFYLSKEVAYNLQTSVNRVDKLALKHNIGRKLRASKEKSIYLFTEIDIHQLKYFFDKNRNENKISKPI